LNLDGTFDYSREVEITFELSDSFILEPAYPNPFRTSTQFAIVVPTDQTITVALYDEVGRLIQNHQILHVAAYEKQTVRLAGRGLHAGRYCARITGKNFTTSTMVVRAR
jgi:hypothetical protein